MTSFTVTAIAHDESQRLLYRREDHSFDTSNALPPDCKLCLAVNEVQLHFGEDMRIRYVTGYCPRQGWRETVWSPPPHSRAALVVAGITSPTAGTAIGLGDSRWPVQVNQDGWVCLGEPSERGDRAVEFAPECIAVLQGGKLVALWLHPLMV